MIAFLILVAAILLIVGTSFYVDAITKGREPALVWFFLILVGWPLLFLIALGLGLAGML